MVTVEEDHLRLDMRFTEKGIAALRAAGREPPNWPPARMTILPRDRFQILDGEYTGMKGNFIRDGEAIRAIDLGRVAPRRD
jgi:hypothetical protein